MKFVTFFIEGIQIEYFNSLYGIESIKVNGRVVSKKFSILGAEHNFAIEGNDYTFRCTSSLLGSYYDLYVNGKPIVESSKNGCLVILLISFAILLLADFFHS